MLLGGEQYHGLCHGHCVLKEDLGFNLRSNSRQAVSSTGPLAQRNKHMPSFLMPMRVKVEEDTGGEDDGKAVELVSHQSPS